MKAILAVIAELKAGAEGSPFWPYRPPSYGVLPVCHWVWGSRRVFLTADRGYVLMWGPRAKDKREGLLGRDMTAADLWDWLHCSEARIACAGGCGHTVPRIPRSASRRDTYTCPECL